MDYDLKPTYELRTHLINVLQSSNELLTHFINVLQSSYELFIFMVMWGNSYSFEHLIITL